MVFVAAYGFWSMSAGPTGSSPLHVMLRGRSMGCVAAPAAVVRQVAAMRSLQPIRAEGRA
jgi:hypothetical protein